MERSKSATISWNVVESKTSATAWFAFFIRPRMAQLDRSGQIEQIYNNWFGKVGMRPSPVLSAMYILQALPE